MQRREIPEEAVRRVALSPEQGVSSRRGREIRPSRMDDPARGRTMLLRVVAEEREESLPVVTAYATSKVEKYWQHEVTP
jgi:hypothetical protein